MNKTVWMFQHPHLFPPPFCLSSFPLNRGTVYNDFVRNRQWYNIESDDRKKFAETFQMKRKSRSALYSELFSFGERSQWITWWSRVKAAASLINFQSVKWCQASDCGDLEPEIWKDKEKQNCWSLPRTFFGLTRDLFEGLCPCMCTEI